MEDAGMHPSMMDHADESSGQVLTAAAAAAAAAAAILPSPDSALTSVREQISWFLHLLLRLFPRFFLFFFFFFF